MYVFAMNSTANCDWWYSPDQFEVSMRSRDDFSVEEEGKTASDLIANTGGG